MLTYQLFKLYFYKFLAKIFPPLISIHVNRAGNRQTGVTAATPLSTPANSPNTTLVYLSLSPLNEGAFEKIYIP